MWTTETRHLLLCDVRPEDSWGVYPVQGYNPVHFPNRNSRSSSIRPDSIDDEEEM